MALISLKSSYFRIVLRNCLSVSSMNLADRQLSEYNVFAIYILDRVKPIGRIDNRIVWNSFVAKKMTR